MAIVALAGFGSLRDDPDGTRAGEVKSISRIKFCWCPKGTFTMGSPPGEPERHNDEGPVQVTLSRGFWIGKYEVTQAQWTKVTNTTIQQQFKKNQQMPRVQGKNAPVMPDEGPNLPMGF